MTTPSDVTVADTAPDAKDGDKAPGAKPTAQDSVESKTQDYDSLPEWAQKEIKRLNSESRDRRIAARDADNAAKEEREKALAQKEEWKILAEERLTTIGNLKVKAEQFDELSVLFGRQYEAEVKEWPSDLLEMAPSEDAPLTAKIAWLEKARPMAKKLMTSAPSDTAAQRQPVGGNRRGPDATTQSLRSQSPSSQDIEPLVDARKKF